MQKVIKQLINSHQLPLKSSGSSMEPVFHEGDVLYFQKTPFNKTKINDIVSIKKGNQLISHRVIYKTNRYLVTKGDNSLQSDGKIYPQQIIGKVYQIKRNGKILHPDQLYLLQSTLYFQEIIKIKQEFEKENINHVFLKGLPLHLYYEGSHPKRIYADCDVLVAIDNFRAAEKILIKNGYRQSDVSLSQTLKQLKDKQVENAYWKNVGGIPVIFDLHTEVVFMMTQLGRLNSLCSQSLIDQLTAEFLKTKRKVTIENESFYLLATNYLLLYLALHLFHHNFRGAFRYQFLDTVIRKSQLTLRFHSGQAISNWQSINKIINNYQLANFVYPVFILLKKYYKTPIPNQFLNSIKPSNLYTFKLLHFYTKGSNIFDDELRIKAGVNRFLNLFLLSPNPWRKKIWVFFNPQVLYSILWVIYQKIRKAVMVARPVSSSNDV